MNIFSKAYTGLKNKLPFVRRPTVNSAYDTLMDSFVNGQYTWVTEPRNKTHNVGWKTYYNAGKNVWINACIKVYVNEVRNLGYKIKSYEDGYVNVPRTNYLTSLFDNPMGLYSQDTYAILHSKLWTSLLVIGDAFCEVIYDDTYTNVPTGFKFIPAQLMHYYENEDQWGFIDNSYRFEPENLIHVKEPSIHNDVWGESPVDVLAHDLILEILGFDFTHEILERKGLDPSGYIKFESQLNDQAYNQEIARMKAEAHQNRHGTLILRGADFKNIGISSEDMQYYDMIKNIRDRILATFGMPPYKVGIIETSNLDLGSGNSQDKNFKKTFQGKAKLFEDAFNKVLGRSAFHEYFKYNDLDIEDKLVKAQIEDIRIKNGTLLPNEVRKSYGQEPIYNTDLIPSQQKNLKMYKNALEHEGLLKQEGFKNYYNGKDTNR